MVQKEKRETGDLPDFLPQTFSQEECGGRTVLKERRATKARLGFWDILVCLDAPDLWVQRETL